MQDENILIEKVINTRVTRFATYSTVFATLRRRAGLGPFGTHTAEMRVVKLWYSYEFYLIPRPRNWGPRRGGRVDALCSVPGFVCLVCTEGRARKGVLPGNFAWSLETMRYCPRPLVGP